MKPTLTRILHFVRKPPQKVMMFMLHLICISLLFLLPEVLVSYSQSHISQPYPALPYIKAIMWVSVFYASYYLITDPTSPLRHAIAKFALQSFLLFVVALSIAIVIWRMPAWLDRPPCPPHATPRDDTFRPSIMVPLLRDSVIIILTIALGLAIRFFQNFREVENRRREAVAREREAELQQLKSQLNPHFLFNTLNTIYALIDIAPQKAQAAIHRLSKMLRYVLYDNVSSVTLGDEFRFAENYIDLMKLRLPPSLPVDIRLDIGDMDQQLIAPMLFINIIENAFKHGTHAPEPGTITISLTARDNIVTCATSNSYARQSAPQTTSAHSRAGIGLANLRRRLDLQYSNRYTLTIEKNDTFNVTLSLDITSPPDMVPTAESDQKS